MWSYDREDDQTCGILDLTDVIIMVWKAWQVDSTRIRVRVLAAPFYDPFVVPAPHSLCVLTAPGEFLDGAPDVAAGVLPGDRGSQIPFVRTRAASRAASSARLASP